MNTIPEDQLQPRALALLAAQRHIYSREKLMHGWQILTVTAIPVAWSLVAAKWHVTVISAYWGLVAIIAHLISTRWRKRLRSKAAKTQELFDCEVLQLPWRDLKLGGKHEEETIAEAAAAYRGGGLQDWYPKQVGILPLELARIVCQRENLWWDAGLRRRYARGALVAAAFLSLCIATTFLFRAATLNDTILLGVIPLAPLLILGINEWWDQIDAAANIDKLKQHAESIWDKALAGNHGAAEITSLSRDLQDEIYDHRKNDIPIFDWVNKKLQRSFESAMNTSAKMLIEQAHASLQPREKERKREKE